MKKLFIVLSVVLSLALAGNVMAFGNCGGEPCEQVTASALPFAGIYQAVNAPGNDTMNGGKAVGEFEIGGEAQATGEDRIVTHWRGTRWEHTHFYKGEAIAYGEVTPTMDAHVVVFTNGKQFNAGLSYSYVKSMSELSIDGEIWAKGNDGCLQTAEIYVAGSLGAFAYGGSYVEGPNGSFAGANGWGQTTVGFEGHEFDQSTYGFLWSPNKASVDFDSLVSVNQELLNLSYVSPDGTTSANFAYVGGGSAELSLGRDGWFGQDNIHLTNIRAEGSVAQNGFATNGAGAYAGGGSSAFFSGAVGSINTPRGWCGPNQTANVGGMAVVGGYNNVTSGPGTLSVTSRQFGYATTGNINIPDAPQ